MGSFVLSIFKHVLVSVWRIFYNYYFQSVSYCLLFNVYSHMSVTILTFTDLWINCTVVRNSVGGGLVGFLMLA